MPKRTDIKKILIIGSGPIVIGQACEFDYSGTQACKVLKAEGFQVVLLNSNPATIMTDPDTADIIYVEPIIPEVVEKIIEKERPDAVLPTLGGQTALNVTIKVAEKGVFDKYNVETIGANIEAIQKAEDRELFKLAMEKIGLDLPRSGKAHTLEQALEVVEKVGLPVIIRPAFTLGGTGGGVAYNKEEFKLAAQRGLEASMVSEILIEELLIGWKEYELEVMRDLNDNVVIICSIENFDPMGVHTGDSITVAPSQTLTDKEYQNMRDAAIACIREIGVETGGSNIQFAVNPDTGRTVIIEMNPRVSRSSALASKATGFPIAKIAAKLAVGYTLDEIPNDITKKTPACFEPTIDYCVVKIPRFTFEKFPEARKYLTTSMKSVGEAMSIERTFKASFQKGLRSLEIGVSGLESPKFDVSIDELYDKLRVPRPERIFYIKYAFQKGMSLEKIYDVTKIDRWFLQNIKEIVELENEIVEKAKGRDINPELLLKAKRYGFSDKQLAELIKTNEGSIRQMRQKLGINSVYKAVDTCGAEFEAFTPYYYSTYESENESVRSPNKKFLVLGGGPNRIGQGIEFDYCCCHASYALEEQGFESIMVNCNPETVSTDYDTSDKLYFEPLTVEDVLSIYEQEKPDGVIVQFGGQTPLNIANELADAGVKIIGTSPEKIDLAEDRDRFRAMMEKLNIPMAESGMASNLDEAIEISKRIGYPLMVRPSYVLGGRAMEVIHDEDMLRHYVSAAVEVTPERPILIDKFLQNAIEAEADALSDGTDAFVPAVMEHIELAGIHSGDSACVIPPVSISKEHLDTISEYTKKIAIELNVVGLMNMQYAITNDTVYVLEANPRASRTVPFVSKVCGISMGKAATQLMLGKKLSELNLQHQPIPHFGVKEAVFPFNMFPEVDPVLGPEMRSTGEVLGLADSFGLAFFKSQQAAKQHLPSEGCVLITVTNPDKPKALEVAREFRKLGFTIKATGGTLAFLIKNGIEAEHIRKMYEGRPNIADAITNSQIQLIINTPSGRLSITDDSYIRKEAIKHEVPYITTTAAAAAAAKGIAASRAGLSPVKSLQSYHTGMK
ncbi:MAG: carbamoyl-phosphate synthase large subunit [Phycisphaerae bacterium]|nr:carbamoyl-phosphate synthase large subunit [Phycisphaerae bacterium]NIP54419.1 carbamoyl-phosphate synthase large subunit [Phycisphaerae bacterium]NIS53278.1 carbamoyl-phosphate synthase large subunit [Phycisphaerae bacterium]NIU10804.1 carbamoyl-phosphate synthase large subunit [Phycisphaerae bacterium]NIU58599.1 carbamoyl-phosphate synthase large subunit [Phycisphaerae bacterium]